jgi:hypothetical protein
VAHSWPKISASSDALIQPANSGGSFLNQSGEIVGVIVSKLNALLGSATRDMIECRRVCSRRLVPTLVYSALNCELADRESAWLMFNVPASQPTSFD